MPISIGQKRESDFTDPIGMLGDCHRRIERFLHVLVVLGREHKGQPLSEEHRGLLANSLRYFREAAPKHTADEEKSLFPQLRDLDAPGTEAVLARIEALERDHHIADRLHAEADRLGEQWLAEGQLAPGAASRFETVTGELEALYRDHIAREDTELFPFASRVLDPARRKKIGQEMAARRGLAAE